MEATSNKEQFDVFTDVYASCPAGKVIVSGGFDVRQEGVPEVEVLYNGPDPELNPKGTATVPTGWHVRAENPLPNGSSWSATAYALCVNPA